MVVAKEVLRLSCARCVVLLRICPDGSTDITALPEDRPDAMGRTRLPSNFSNFASARSVANGHPRAVFFRSIPPLDDMMRYAVYDDSR